MCGSAAGRGCAVGGGSGCGGEQTWLQAFASSPATVVLPHAAFKRIKAGKRFQAPLSAPRPGSSANSARAQGARAPA